VRWYLRYSLSLRDVEELLNERGLEADHTTVWRWVQRYGPELEQRLRRHLRPTNKSWRADETHIRVMGRLVLPLSGHRFQRCHNRLPALRIAGRPRRQTLSRKALSNLSHSQPRVINTDLAPIYGSAISDIKQGRDSSSPLSSATCTVLEQHYRARPPSDQTSDKGQAGVPRIPDYSGL
jgi:transposase, IS6 family